MPIIAIASTKGGVGKSTVAVNLMAELAERGEQAVLLEVDKQASASKWNRVREAYIAQGDNLPSIYMLTADGKALSDVAMEKSQQGAIVIIDSPGVDSKSTRTALLHADAILTLSAPSPFDVWEVEPILKLASDLGRLQQRRLPVYLLFNQVPTNVFSTAIDDTKQFMQENLIQADYVFKSALRRRAVYQHAVKEGRGVNEYQPKDPSARQEFSRFCDELLSLLTHINVEQKIEGDAGYAWA